MLLLSQPPFSGGCHMFGFCAKVYYFMTYLSGTLVENGEIAFSIRMFSHLQNKYKPAQQRLNCGLQKREEMIEA